MADGQITYKITVDNTGAIKSIDQVDQAANKVGEAGDKASNHIMGIGIAAGIAQAAATKAFNAIASSMDAAISRADTMRNFPLVMSNLGISAEDADASLAKLNKGLDGLPTTMDSAVQSVQRFTSANGDISKSTDYFLAMNNAILAGGAPMEQQATAMEQLSQAYAKGKPDMMEWRSMLSAMPAQLNQVAQSMGMSTEQLGEGLRNGTISMEEFMQQVVLLNEQGTGEFASFAEQAKNATGGIATSIANVKTAITRNLANIIAAVNENGEVTDFFGKMREAIDKIGGAIVAAIPHIKSFLENLKPFLPIIAAAVAAFVALEAAMKIQALIQGVRMAFMALNATLLANPILAVIMAVTALVTWLITLWNTNDEFRAKVTAAWEAVKTTATNVFNAVADFFRVTIPNAISGFVQKVQELPGKMLQLGINIIQGIARGIASAPQAVFNALKDAVFGAVNKIKAWLGIESPSKYMAQQVGQWLPKGLAVGIEANTDSVNAAMRDLSDTVMSYDLGVNTSPVSSTSQVTYASALNTGGVMGEIRALRSAIEDLKIYLDTGQLVGGIVSQMDNALGRMEIVGAR